MTERYEDVMKKQARQRGYEVIGELKPEDVLPFTGPDAEPRYFFNYLAKMTSLRYQTFSKSIKCACCGIEGTIMLLELPNNGGDVCIPHFNLYAEREGELVQMTKDHIKSKSRGGKDHICNMQTMCSRCNELKGSHATKLKRLREIQDGVQTIYTVVTPAGLTLDNFATSVEGLKEIITRFISTDDLWKESEYQIRVNFKQREIYLENKEEAFVFTIKPIKRV